MEKVYVLEILDVEREHRVRVFRTIEAAKAAAQEETTTEGQLKWLLSQVSEGTGHRWASIKALNDNQTFFICETVIE